MQCKNVHYIQSQLWNHTEKCKRFPALVVSLTIFSVGNVIFPKLTGTSQSQTGILFSPTPLE